MSQQWQPMSTAKDGTLILAYDGSHMVVARWCVLLKMWCLARRCEPLKMRCAARWCAPLKFWWSDDDCLDDEQLIAWTTLPDAPETVPEEIA